MAPDPVDIELPAEPTTAPPPTSASAPSKPAPVQGAGSVPANTGVMDLEDPNFKRYDVEFYKGRKGIFDRIALLDPKHIAWARRHFQQGENSLAYFKCLSKYENAGGQDVKTQQAICCDKLGEPRRVWATPVIVYGTDIKGNPVKPFTFQLLIWRFGDERLDNLRSLARDWPLAKHDIRIECTEETYQRMTLTPVPTCIWTADSFQQVYGEQVRAWLNGVVPRLAHHAVRERTLAEVTKGLGGVVAGAVVAADEPITDVSELIGS